ncbi:hypothetical protein V1478_007190 [Vespula squamosa]|uniref:Uncharacterized protein n=1 Tax=Vespula squamosa TaxID=30214 RepID=A0ABD2B2F9_VESSQ
MRRTVIVEGCRHYPESLILKCTMHRLPSLPPLSASAPPPPSLLTS